MHGYYTLKPVTFQNNKFTENKFTASTKLLKKMKT